jgi:hypothetical protein
MFAARLAHLPIDHVVAEIAAFPLASTTALAAGVTSLQPLVSRAAAAQTARLWRAAESRVLGGCPGFSVDEAVALRDRIWFQQNPDQPVPLHDYLRQLAEWFLVARGAIAVPRLPPDEQAVGASQRTCEARARQAWRWLSFALPEDLLLAALNRGRHGPRRVALLSPTLSMDLRDRQFAECHLHLGAAMDFSTLWLAGLHALAQGDFKHDSLRSPGAELDEGRDLAPWLIRAVSARYVLAGFLAWRADVAGEGRFTHYLQVELPQRIVPHVGPTGHAQLMDGLRQLRQGRLALAGQRSSDFTAWQALYANLTRLNARRFPQDQLEQLLAADPASRLFPDAAAGGTTVEQRWIAEALDYLGDPRAQRDDGYALFNVLFWQVVRVRCLLYRHVVQRPMTPGLQFFIRHYARPGPLKRPLGDALMLQSAARVCGAGRGLRALEVRTAPNASRSQLLTFVRQLDAAARRYRLRTRRDDLTEGDTSQLEVGIVFHFTKSRQGGATVGLPNAHWRGSTADPDALVNPTGCRYAEYFRQRRQEALALAQLLHRYPLALEIVRGLDVCTDELGVPNWVLAPLIRYVRAAADSGGEYLRRTTGREMPPLRTTAHAGEDFVHLLTGLRHIDEAVERFQMREGDRIGHGLSLGTDPLAWSRRAGRLPMTREERLFDLVWAWRFAGELADAGIRDWCLRLEQQIAELSARIFSRELSPYDLWRLMESLFDLQQLRQAGFPDRRTLDDLSAAQLSAADDVQRLLLPYLRSTELFRRGREIIWIDPSSEAEPLLAVQNELRRKVGARGLVVEVNPTSNLLVGDLGDLTNHPLWRLRPPVSRADVPPVSVAVGSDDPVIFVSWLRDEYQLLADAMTLAGLSAEDSLHWLDRTRACSLESRFTLRGRSPEPLTATINPERLLTADLA